MHKHFGHWLLLAGAGLALAAPAHAANDVMKACGAKYQAAKANNTLGGKTWAQFLAECRGSGATPAAAAKPAGATAPAAPSAKTAHLPSPQSPAPAAKPAVAAATAPAAPSAKTAHLPNPKSPGMAAMHDRQRQCGAQWKADKAAGKIPAGQTWPQYWSACNTRLKG